MHDAQEEPTPRAEPPAASSGAPGDTSTHGVPGDTSTHGAPAAPGPRRFEAGQLVGGRFRILRFLAEGAMGEVYEAEDTELGEPVALKTVRGELSEDPRIVDRFRREIRLARKVTHPNVCRVFDVFTHPAEGAAPPVLFLTMELLQGETLSQRLRRGRLGEHEALPLVRQMAQALAAAHAAGIVHRDFKSSNVMLVELRVASSELRASHPPATRNSLLATPEVRVVVTDFGLAHSSRRDSGQDASATAGGLLVGTPLYMAPEQVEGQKTTAATDLYALGVVMYEMLTGTWPFLGATSFKTAVLRLQEPPPAPSSRVPGIDPRWETAILCCLERDPARRYGNTEELLAALDPGHVAPRARGRLGRRAVLAVLLLGLGGLSLGWLLGGPAGPPAAPGRKAVAVLGLRNLSGRAEDAWLSTALPEMLSTELAAGEALRRVPGESVARVRLELGLRETDSFAPETLARLRQNLGTDFVVTGSYLTLGDGNATLRLDLSLQDTQSGEVLATLSESGGTNELLELVSHAGLELRRRLGVAPPSALQSVQARAALSRSPEAMRLYSEGLARAWAFENAAACELFGRALSADPGFALAHAALSQVWEALGHEQKAIQAAERAFRMARGLGREDRLVVELLYRRWTGEKDKAHAIAMALHTFFPDNLQYGLDAARYQLAAGRKPEALATLAGLRQLPPPAGDSPKLDLLEAEIAGRLPDVARALEANSRAAKKARALGALLLEAHARIGAGDALRLLGRTEEAMASFAQAERIFAAVGDWMQQARVLRLKSYVLGAQGKSTVAAGMLEQALAVYQEIGNRHEAAETLQDLAQHGVARGDLAGARAQLEQSQAVAREIGDEDLAATADEEMGWILYLQGDPGGSRQLLEALEKRSARLGNRALTEWANFGIGELDIAQGKLEEARRRLEAALAGWSTIGRKSGVARSRLALARLALEEGRPEAAEPLALEAAEEFRHSRGLNREASARAVLALCLLAQGKAAEAREQAAAAEALAAQTDVLEPRFVVRLAAARVLAAGGGPTETTAALGRLEEARADAQRAGFVAFELEARLALGQIELSAGKPGARARLQALQTEAATRGFGLIERKAAQ